MAESSVCKTYKDGTITLADSGASNSYTIAFEQGDFTADSPGPTINEFQDRGEYTATPCVREGAQQGSSGSFTCALRDVTDGAVAVALDFIHNKGFVLSGWTSTLGANAEVFTVSITITIEGSDHGDGADHTIVYNHCRLTGGWNEGDFDTISFAWKSYEDYPTVT